MKENSNRQLENQQRNKGGMQGTGFAFYIVGVSKLGIFLDTAYKY